MKTYKESYTKNGKRKKCKNWYLTFVDNRQIRRKLKAYTDKSATDKLGIRLQQLLESNGVLDNDLQKWFTGLTAKIKEKIIEFDLVDNRRFSENIGKTLDEHIEDFRAALTIRSDSETYPKEHTNKVSSVFTACGFKYWNDIDANRIYTCLAERCGDDGTGQRTFNAYLQAIKQFCRWMIKERRAMAPSPLEHLSPVKQTKFRHKRRALELDELRKLLRTTKDAPERFGMTGYERYLLYRTAVESGLRVNELRSLTVSSFDFKDCTVTVEAGFSKHRRQDILSLRKDTAQELKEFFIKENKTPGVKAFGGTYKRLTDKTAEMIRKDLKDAGIEYCVDGKFFDFHSQRHETGTLLASSGVDVKTAQSLMRHQDVNLTMSIYSHTLRGAESKAVEKMPSLAVEPDRKSLTVA